MNIKVGQLRRKDRAVIEEKKILSIMARCQVCTLSMCSAGEPYGVPVNFGIMQKGEDCFLCFHGAPVGKKAEALLPGTTVAFSMYTAETLVPGEKASDCTMDFESVCGSGVVEEIRTEEERAEVLTAIMRQYWPDWRGEWNASDLKAGLWKVRIQQWCGKRHTSA